MRNHEQSAAREIGMRARLLRLLRLGLDEREGEREANHVILTNAIALIAVLQLFPLVGLAVAAGLHLVVYWIVGTSLAFLSVPAVSSSGRVRLARAWLAVVSAVGIVGACWLLGPGMHVEMYLLVAVSATWNVWSAARHAILVTLLFVLAYLAVLVVYASVSPLDPPSPTLVPLLNIGMFMGVMLALIGIVAWSHWQTTITDRRLDHEHARSERLLRNVLP